MSDALKALVAKQGDRLNWEKAIDQLQWCILNNRAIPEHLRQNYLRKTDVLRRQPEFAYMDEQKGYSFHNPFDNYLNEHWDAVRALAKRLSDAQ